MTSQKTPNTLDAFIDARIKYIRNLIADGKPEFAQFECAKLVAQYPNNIMALCLMTYVFYIANDPKNALRYARLAFTKITSDSTWQEIVSASNALLMVGEIEEANSVMQQLDLSKLSDVSELCYVAKHYGSLDQIEAAAKIFDQVAQGQLDFHSRQMYGVALLYLGKFVDAKAEFEKAIALNPQDGVSYNQLSVLKLSDNRDDRIARMQIALESPSLDAVNKSYLHFSLFNEFDAANNTEMAWQHLEKANQVRRATVHHDSLHDLQACQNLVENYRHYSPARSADKNGVTPIFIVGLPRTGTTLLEKILSAFDEVQACGELRAFRRELELATNSNFINPLGLGFQKNIDALDFEYIGREYLRKNRWRHDGKKYFTDKEPSNYTYAGLIARAIPGAKIIHIRRNPMDACFSNYKQFFGPSSFTYSYDLAEIAEHYKIYDALMALWKSQMPESLLEIKYERLVSDPDGQAERIRRFCGLSTSEKGKTGNADYVTSTLSAAQVRAPIHGKNVNSWMRYQTQLQSLSDALHEYIANYDSELVEEMGS